MSGEWFGEIPEHWESEKIGALFAERRMKVSDKDYPPLSVAKIGVVPQLETAVKTDAGDNRKLVCAGDFVINSRSDRKGSCGVSILDGSVSLINIVLTPRGQLSGGYTHYLLRSQPFAEEYYRNGRGIVSDLWTTRYSEMKSIMLPVPPRDEQEQIVRFLDWKVSAINRLIAVKRKQIATLNELMYVKIERILFSRPIKNIVRLKQLGTFFKGGGFSRDNLVESEGCPAILYGDIYTQYEYKTNTIVHHIDFKSYNTSRKVVKNDIVMAGTGETKDEIGKSILYLGNDEVAVGGDVIVFRPNEAVNAEYLLYQLYSQAALQYRYFNGKGDIIVHISSTTLGSMPISFPDEDDQTSIVKNIDEVINNVKTNIAIIDKEISVLYDLKARLISDVVTGKIDVRGVEVPEFAPVEEEVGTDMNEEEVSE